MLGQLKTHKLFLEAHACTDGLNTQTGKGKHMKDPQDKNKFRKIFAFRGYFMDLLDGKRLTLTK